MFLKLAVVFLLFLVVYFGIGILIVRAIYSSQRQPDLTLWENGLVGLIGASFISGVLQLFLPMKMIAIILIPIGTASFAVQLFKRKIKLSKVQCLVSMIGTFAFSYFILRNGIYYDTGLYHLPKLGWLSEHPVVLGLGNLHGRLAFPDFWLVNGSLFLGIGPQFLATFSLNGFFFFLTTMVILFPSHKRSAESNVFGYLLLVGIVIVFHDQAFYAIGSPGTDLPAALAVILSFFYWTEVFNDREVKSNQDILLWCSICGAISFKLSSAPVILLLVFLVLRRGIPKCLLDFPVRRLFLSSIFFGLLLILRSFLSSGCLVYPIGSTCTNVFWSVGKDQALIENQWIKSWARLPFQQPEIVLSNWDWLSDWWPKFYSLFSIQFMIVVFVVYLLSLPFMGIGHLKRRRAVLGPFVAVTGIVFWFSQAPDLRFGFGFFVALFAYVTSYLVERIGRIGPFRSFKGPILASCLVFISLGFRVEWANLPALTRAEWPSIPKSDLDEKNIDGVSFFKPKTGDQCWNAPLMCAPSFSDALKLSNFGAWIILRNSPK